jgi:hypothetical protein
MWETAQLPLYTLWVQGTPLTITAAAFHCLIGDVAIAAVALSLALALFGSPAWPHENFLPVLATVIGSSIGYTIYSEYMNTAVRQSWTYAEAMPRLPGIGTGLAPLMQWLIIPPLALLWACRR